MGDCEALATRDRITLPTGNPMNKFIQRLRDSLTTNHHTLFMDILNNLIYTNKFIPIKVRS